MKYSLESCEGTVFAVDPELTETLEIRVGAVTVTFDPLDVGVICGILQTWLIRGGQPQ